MMITFMAGNNRGNLLAAEAHFAHDLRAKARLQFADDVAFPRAIEFVSHGRLDDLHGQNAVTDRDRDGMCGQEVAYDVAPRRTDLLFIQSLGKSQLAKEPFQRVGGMDAPFARDRLFGQSPPFLEHLSANFLAAHQQKGPRRFGGLHRGIW